MAKQEYTEEQKKAVLERVAEIGVREAAAEAGIPWQAVARWNKNMSTAKNSEKTKDRTADREEAVSDEQAAIKAGEKIEGSDNKDARPGKKANVTVKAGRKAVRNKHRKNIADQEADDNDIEGSAAKDTPVPDSADLYMAEIIEGLKVKNAVLESENRLLKEQVEKLKNAVSDLI